MGRLFSTGQVTHVCDLNDAFHRCFSSGGVVVTAGIAALPETIRTAVLSAVRGFDAFDAHSDAHGEHDFGVVAVGDLRVFWKIEAYDGGLRGHSPDPADSTVTARVLTVMLAEEY